MLSLSTKLVPGLNASNAIKSSARSVFTLQSLGIENFKSYTETFRKDNENNSSAIKAVIKEALAKPDIKIFTEDLKSFKNLVQTEDELNTLIEAIKKYRTQPSTGISNFSFESPLMRLLYTMNQTNKALELYFKDETFGKSITVTALLMNKLIEERRYSDAIKVGNHYINTFKAQLTAEKQADPNKRFTFSANITKLFTEALLRQNDADAFEQSKKLLNTIKEFNSIIPERSIAHVILLALDHKSPDFAFELINGLERINLRLKLNLKIMCLIDLKRVDEALSVAQDIAKMDKGPFPFDFFQKTLNKLAGAVESDQQKKTQVQTLIDSEKASNRVQNQDPVDYFTFFNAFRPQRVATNEIRGFGLGDRRPNQDGRRPYQDDRRPYQDDRRQYNSDRRPFGDRPPMNRDRFRPLGQPISSENRFQQRKN